jgi:hypothetical protein
VLLPWATGSQIRLDGGARLLVGIYSTEAEQEEILHRARSTRVQGATSTLAATAWKVQAVTEGNERAQVIDHTTVTVTVTIMCLTPAPGLGLRCLRVDTDILTDVAASVTVTVSRASDVPSAPVGSVTSPDSPARHGSPSHQIR